MQSIKEAKEAVEGGSAEVSCHGITVLVSHPGVAVVTTFWLSCISLKKVEHRLKLETQNNVYRALRYFSCPKPLVYLLMQ